MLVAGLYLISIGLFLFLSAFVRILLMDKTIKNVRAYVNLAYSFVGGGAILTVLHFLKNTFNLW